MNLNSMASVMDAGLTSSTMIRGDGVVEIGLLLPTNRAQALMQLARDRHESVGQVLRRLIERELAEPAR